MKLRHDREACRRTEDKDRGCRWACSHTQAGTQAHKETSTQRGSTCPSGQKRTQETTKNMAVSKGPASVPPC
jgi:hypothetical protein